MQTQRQTLASISSRIKRENTYTLSLMKRRKPVTENEPLCGTTLSSNLLANLGGLNSRTALQTVILESLFNTFLTDFTLWQIFNTFTIQCLFQQP